MRWRDNKAMGLEHLLCSGKAFLRKMTFKLRREGSEGVRLRKNGLACSSQRTVYADGKEVGTL